MINSDMARVVRAAYFAGEKHKNQRRTDVEETPYINHPLELASILVDEGLIDDVDVLCAALLHDTIEDTNTNAAELESLFGERVAKIVVEVTNDMTQNSATRKIQEVASIPGLSHEAKLIKLADKLANIRDVSTMPPVGWTLEKKQAYFDFALSIVEKAKEASPPLYEIFCRDYAKLKID
jgi:guanosine-3',5'-bis(diphosphate) 3'-pyrophosphohydrolase